MDIQKPTSSIRQDILEEAVKCVMKDRNAIHGSPEDNFNTIADYWNTYLFPLGVGRRIIAQDVAAMMILMKMARLHTSPEHKDHWVDIAGYAACGGEIALRVKTQKDEAFEALKNRFPHPPK